MNTSIELVRKFLADEIKLEQVELSDISHGIYESEQLNECDIFKFSLFQSLHIGSAKYIAVPKNLSKPFYLGEIGE